MIFGKTGNNLKPFPPHVDINFSINTSEISRQTREIVPLSMQGGVWKETLATLRTCASATAPTVTTSNL